MQSTDENLIRLTTLVVQTRDLIDQTRARIQEMESYLADRLPSGSASPKVFYPALGAGKGNGTVWPGEQRRKNL
ncbi:MAG: hypothetical protein HYY23_18620 [Verrucomicrobia bacterium]|nr:hypothetical protein [Verrucomicrobiota bacterium]